MRHSPAHLLFGAALLVAVPYALIRAGESFLTVGPEIPGGHDASRKVMPPGNRTLPSNDAPPAAASGPASEVAPSPEPETAADLVPLAPSARLTADEFAELVRASDATSLDQDVGMNADFREHGVGLVPRILSIDPGERSARLAARAIEAVFRLPFGWFATDDGRRTFVFDDDGRIQIRLNLRRFRGASLADFARSLVKPYVGRESSLSVMMLQFEGNIFGAGVRGAEIDGELRDQIFLVRAAGRPGYVLVADVTVQGGDSRLALNLAGDILSGLEPGGELVAQN